MRVLFATQLSSRAVHFIQTGGSALSNIYVYQATWECKGPQSEPHFVAIVCSIVHQKCTYIDI